jgi:Glucose-6-P dehydrogenase subunit
MGASGWEEAAERTLAGLAEQHPSRTILLFPQPDDDDGLDLDASVQFFAAGPRTSCAEVIRVRLCGDRSRHPSSIVVPLLVADLPVFCRWRGLPEFDEVFDEVVEVVDRLIVDSTEWPSDTLSQGYGKLAKRSTAPPSRTLRGSERSAGGASLHSRGRSKGARSRSRRRAPRRSCSLGG